MTEEHQLRKRAETIREIIDEIGDDQPDQRDELLSLSEILYKINSSMTSDISDQECKDLSLCLAFEYLTNIRPALYSAIADYPMPE